jgi:hypothetical protein
VSGFTGNGRRPERVAPFFLTVFAQVIIFNVENLFFLDTLTPKVEYIDT